MVADPYWFSLTFFFLSLLELIQKNLSEKHRHKILSGIKAIAEQFDLIWQSGLNLLLHDFQSIIESMKINS